MASCLHALDILADTASAQILSPIPKINKEGIRVNWGLSELSKNSENETD